jgi:hypothetical protein
MMMMIPEAWSNNQEMEAQKRAFYEYHSCLMEPWDGPASIAFSDGRYVGALLDRNGLRPSRYVVTRDDIVIMASEAGVLPVDEEKVITKGRLQPGKMFLVDTQEKRIIDDEEIKKSYASRQPYEKWLRDNIVDLRTLPEPKKVHGLWFWARKPPAPWGPIRPWRFCRIAPNPFMSTLNNYSPR